MKTFWIRTASATVYALLFIGSIYSGRLIGNTNVGIIILTAFALFAALGCAFEYYRIAEMQANHPNKPLGYIFTTLMVLVLSLLPLCYNEMEAGSVFCFTLVSLMGLLLFVSLPIVLARELWRNSEHPFGDTLHTLLPVIYCALPLGLMSIIHYECNILMMCIIMVWVNDSFAYMGGSLFGKHKLWPKHSPGKTWEGTAIGVAACVAVGILVGPLFNAFPYHPIGWPIWLLLALVCSIIGTIGDLVESMLKRSVGLKDSGNIMPGHGGFLDRFDSLLMIIPFAALIAIFVTAISF